MLTAWAAAVPAHAVDDDSKVIRTFESSLLPAVSVTVEPEQRWSLAERMAHWKVPGISIAVIRNGRIEWAKGYGVLQAGKPEKIDTQTVFSTGSISKVGAAAITLRLADAGKLDLDRNVNSYLTRWQVPENQYTAVRPVTLRGILSHSAGLSVHGFGDFQPGVQLPTVIDTLEGRSPSDNDPVRVIYTPGSKFQYSGGGTTVEQLLIEDVTGVPFTEAARRYVFGPLRMTRSTYENPLPVTYGNVAKAHGSDGEVRALPRGYEAMPEMAASGLWTTPSDYAQLVIALIESYQGKPGSFLSTALARQMMTEVGRSQVGLGPFLEGEGLDRRFSHGGANDSYHTWMEGHLATGNGMVVFTNGSRGQRLYEEVRRAVALAEGWAPALSYHEQVRALQLSAAELAEKAGIYAVQAPTHIADFRSWGQGASYVIFQRDGSLYMSSTGASTGGTRLIAADASHFVGAVGGVFVEFVRDYAGVISDLVVRTGRFPGSVTEARKVSP